MTAPIVNPPVLVMAGLRSAVSAMENLQVFKEIVAVDSSAELLKVIDQYKQVWGRDDVVFLIGDTTDDNHASLSLSLIVLKLSNNRYKVIVVPTTVGGSTLAPPTAKIVTVPLTANKILYAVNSMGYSLGHDNDADETKTYTTEKPVVSEKTPAPKVSSEPLETSQAKQPKFSGSWGTPTTVSPDREQAVQTPEPARAFVANPQTQGPADRLPVRDPAAQGLSKRPSLFNTVSNNSTQAEAPPAYSGPVPRTGYTSTAARTGRRGYVVTIAVAKGGTGKSSLTLNLAAYMGMRASVVGKTVCVIDSNFQQADAGKYLSVYTPNIHTITTNPALLTQEYILQGLAHKPEYNLSVLLGPTTADEGNPANLTPELYNEILALLKVHYDYIFIDTPVAEKYHQMFEKFSIPNADYIVVPVTPNMATIQDTDDWLKAAVVSGRDRRGGIPEDRIGIVLNRAEENIGCDELEVQQCLARWEYLGSIPETAAWKLANNRNELVVTKQNVEGVAAINEAIASILYKATGEPFLLGGSMPEESSSMWRKIFRRK